jgi:hypothetical protein
LATAAGNYTNKYQQDLSQLLQTLWQSGTASQPLIQRIAPGIIPGISYDPNAPLNQNPYGQNAPYDSNPDYENQYGRNQEYSQGIQQGGYDGQAQGSGYPTDPNYGTVPSSNTYPQEQGYYYPNPDEPEPNKGEIREA